MKLPVLIPYITTVDAGNELRHALRSLENIENWNGEVYIVGYCEYWFSDEIHYIPCTRRYPTYNADVESKIVTALQQPDFPEHFIFSNDDIFITEPTTVTSYHQNELFGSTANYHQRAKLKTADYLKSIGIARPLDYAVHTPMVMNKTNRLSIHELIKPSFIGTPLQARNMYGNIYPIKAEYYKDRKTKTPNLKTGKFISTQYFTDELTALFPRPSRFEK